MREQQILIYLEYKVSHDDDDDDDYRHTEMKAMRSRC
jgi:hypothetical protein